ncbi:alpha-actinin-4-like [Watersipora subatra]|uniref:alpha-actinin-4-like n=1 Tax=Watersipora subatra TaxID=2589382 RepID=UPI00355B1F54
MAEGGGGDAKSRILSKTSHFWSRVSVVYDEKIETIRRRDLRDYTIPISVLNLDAADRKVIQIADVRDRIQTKTFTKWVNKHLRKRSLEVKDLFEGFRDGTKLLTLLEVLTSQILPRERGTLRFHRLQNVKAALDFLTHQSIRLVNIHPEEIADGNPKITLGLIWIIILKFQCFKVKLESVFRCVNAAII